MTNIVALQQSSPNPDPAPCWDDFWTLYPRHVARRDAIKAWSRLTPADQLAAIVGAATWRPIWLRRGEPQFTPYPATFLNGARWEDEPPAEVAMSHASHAPALTTPAPARQAMPEHIKETLRKLRGKP